MIDVWGEDYSAVAQNQYQLLGIHTQHAARSTQHAARSTHT